MENARATRILNYALADEYARRQQLTHGSSMGHWEKTTYKQRDDLSKIQSQWTKLKGHHSREDWSAAVVRAATACEIAVNFAVRREYAAKDGHINVDAVNTELMRANGLKGKLQKILLPLIREKAHNQAVRELKKLALTINDKRNLIVHSGEFCEKPEATALIEQCAQFVVGLVTIYEPKFKLREVTPRTRS